MALHNKIAGILFVALFAVITTSCKKEKNPTLYVTVVDTLGTPLWNARVYTHPCLDKSCDTTKLNLNFIKEGYTNSKGQVDFTFPYTAIIDVQASWTQCDTPDVWCMNAGQTVARFETKKLKKDQTNDYNVRVVVYPVN